MNLELYQISPYIPYKLKVLSGDAKEIYELSGIAIREGAVFYERFIQIAGEELPRYYNQNIIYCKPILRPLSDISKIIEHDGKRFSAFNVLAKSASEYIPEKNLNKKAVSELLGNYSQVEKLIEWHFDVFGLIDKGLAIPYLSVLNKP